MCRNLYLSGVAAAILAAAGTCWAQQQTMPLRLIPTTLVIEKLAAATDPLDPRMIRLGVSSVTYEFYLRDAFTDLEGGDTEWSSVWQSARQFRPNFQVQGGKTEELAAIKPGEVMTVRGMCFPATRTFEITEINPGAPFEEPGAY